MTNRSKKQPPVTLEDEKESDVEEDDNRMAEWIEVIERSTLKKMYILTMV